MQWHFFLFSPHFRDVYEQGAAPESKKQEEEVPWWAEFDKTYELQKQAEKVGYEML